MNKLPFEKTSILDIMQLHLKGYDFICHDGIVILINIHNRRL